MPALAACAGDVVVPASDEGGGAPVTASAEATTDVASTSVGSSSTASSGSGDLDPRVSFSAYVDLENRLPIGGSATSTALAGFVEATWDRSYVPCEETSIGPCRLRACDDDRGGFEVEDQTPEIVFTGTAVDVELAADPTGQSPNRSFSSSVPLFEPGAELMVSSAGTADVAAFSATVRGPGTTRFTSGLDAYDLTVDAGDDFAMAWEAGENGGELELLVRTGGNPDAWMELSCRYPVSDGAGVVPAEALDALSGDETLVFDATVVSETEVDAAPYRVTFTAHEQTTRPDGEIATGLLVIE